MRNSLCYYFYLAVFIHLNNWNTPKSLSTSVLSTFEQKKNLNEERKVSINRKPRQEIFKGPNSIEFMVKSTSIDRLKIIFIL